MRRKIDKNVLSSRSLSLATVLFQFCVALMPVLYLLNVPVLNVSLGTILVILFLPYSGYHIVRCYKENRKQIKSFENLAGMLLFALFYLYFCLRSGGGLNTIVLSIGTLAHLWGSRMC